jgi:hypothetical protein
MDTSGPSFATRLFRAFRNLVLFSLFVGLAGAAIYALSLVNSRTYSLEVMNGHLVVLKGRMLPTGFEAWSPSDPTLADTYAPLDLEGNSPSVVGKKFSERDELDRAIFSVLETLAGPRIASDLPKDSEQALTYTRRGDRLKGLSEEQKTSLKKMKSDLAFYLAQQRLDDSRRQLEEALVQLKLAAESDSKHRAEANVMLMAIEPQVKLLAGTLRTATAMSGTGTGGLDALVKQIETGNKELDALIKKTVPAPAGTPDSAEKPKADEQPRPADAPVVAKPTP